MEINVFDNNLNKIAIVDVYTSLMWCKRYYDVGALDLQIEATTENLSLFKKDYFISRNDDDTFFQIKAIELDTASDHDNHLIIGAVDCKSILNQRLIWDFVSFSGTVENYIRKLINDNIISPTVSNRKIDNFMLKNVKGFTETIKQQSSFDNLGEKIIDVCKSYYFGCKVTFENGIFYFDLFKGVDRSQNQTENNPIVFSPEYDNLASSKYNFDSTKYKNVALIGGEGEGKDRKTTYVGNSSGLNRYEIFVDCSSDSTNTEETITDEEYFTQLKSKGTNELAKQATTTSFEGQIITDSYKYKVDYDLGDIVTLKNEYGISVNARIVEIVETWDSDGYTLEPKFEYMEVQTSGDGEIVTENSMLLMTESRMALVNENSISTSDSVKISELPEATEIKEGCCLPIVQDSETKRLYFSTMQNTMIDTMLDKIYPVGSIYMSSTNVSPETLFGGQWEQLKDRFLVGAGNSYSNGSTGGNKTHTHKYRVGVNGYYGVPIGTDTALIRTYNYESNSWVDATRYSSFNTTKNASISKVTNNADAGRFASEGKTSVENNLPPYLAVYIWKRIG